MPQQPFTLGVNYWPRRKAMAWWSNFDRGEVREEFAIIREYGMTLVRVFLLWDDWQPEPDRVSFACLDTLAAVCDAAADNGLQLDVTFFTGHMSGPNGVPRWLLGGAPPQARQVISGGKVVRSGYRNPFVDPVALQAERLLLKTVVGALKSHPAIGMWNLGNEPDLFARPPNADRGRAWVGEMTDLVHAIDEHPLTCGLHMASLAENNGFRVDQVFRATDVAVMHSLSHVRAAGAPSARSRRGAVHVRPGLGAVRQAGADGGIRRLHHARRRPLANVGVDGVLSS